MSIEESGLRADTIVVAAGRSSRMDGTDKLAVEIGGRPLLAWTLDALAASPTVERMVVVTSEERRAEVAAASWLPSAVIDVVGGGARRQESVRLWIVRRADIQELDDPDLLQPPLDRSFKKPGGYVMRDKLEQARRQAGTRKPKARDR